MPLDCFHFFNQTPKRNLHVPSYRQTWLVQLAGHRWILRWCLGRFPPLSPLPITPVAHKGHAPRSLWAEELYFSYVSYTTIKFTFCCSLTVLQFCPYAWNACLSVFPPAPQLLPALKASSPWQVYLPVAVTVLWCVSCLYATHSFCFQTTNLFGVATPMT